MFCQNHKLSPSVKAGGYGTAGWAIGGDIIIELSKLTEVDIEPPLADGSFTSLKDVAAANSKGKKPVGSGDEPPNTGKRRREDDIALRSYDSASHAVASFLRGLPNVVENDLPPPSTKRRLDNNSPSGLDAPAVSSQFSTETSGVSRSNSSSSSGFDSSAGDASSLATNSTAATSPSLSGLSAPSATKRTISQPGDPFGYIDEPAETTPFVVQTPYRHLAMPRSWAATGLFDDPANSLGLDAQAEPLYPHAFVTFGAGMRQKEIDTYTAQHKLEAKNSMSDGIPYHVPL